MTDADASQYKYTEALTPFEVRNTPWEHARVIEKSRLHCRGVELNFTQDNLLS